MSGSVDDKKEKDLKNPQEFLVNTDPSFGAIKAGIYRLSSVANSKKEEVKCVQIPVKNGELTSTWYSKTLERQCQRFLRRGALIKRTGGKAVKENKLGGNESDVSLS